MRQSTFGAPGILPRRLLHTPGQPAFSCRFCGALIDEFGTEAATFGSGGMEIGEERPRLPGPPRVGKSVVTRARLARQFRIAQLDRVLEPIWHKTPETANRVRLRCEAVIDFAKASGYRTDPNNLDNPTRCRRCRRSSERRMETAARTASGR